MEILLQAALLILGFVMLVKGADFLWKVQQGLQVSLEFPSW